MGDQEQPDEPTTERGATPVSDPSPAKAPYSDRPFLKPLGRPYTEKELSTGVAQNFLLSDIQRLQQELRIAQGDRRELTEKLEAVRELYHEKHSMVLVLEGQINKSSVIELISNIALIVGSALAGLAPGMLTTTGPAAGPMHTHGWIVLFFGLFLLVGCIAAKGVQAGWFRRVRGAK